MIVWLDDLDLGEHAVDSRAHDGLCDGRSRSSGQISSLAREEDPNANPTTGSA
jgi:hypothetical protein